MKQPKEHEYYADIDGVEFLGYDEDPARTIINPTAQHLTGERNSFDNIFADDKYHYRVFENCGGKNEPAFASRKSSSKMNQRSIDMAKLRMPLLRGPQLKAQLEERRSIIKRLRN